MNTYTDHYNEISACITSLLKRRAHAYRAWEATSLRGVAAPADAVETWMNVVAEQQMLVDRLRGYRALPELARDRLIGQLEEDLARGQRDLDWLREHHDRLAYVRDEAFSRDLARIRSLPTVAVRSPQSVPRARRPRRVARTVSAAGASPGDRPSRRRRCSFAPRRGWRPR